MEEEVGWHFIEGAIKSLSSQLQSFPDEVKEKALKLLGTQLHNSTEQQSNSTADDIKSVTLREEADDKKDFVSEVSTSSLPRKCRRVRQQKLEAVESTVESKSPCAKSGLRSRTRRKSAPAEEEPAEPMKRVTRTNGQEVKRRNKDTSQNALAESVNETAVVNHKEKSESGPLKSENDGITAIEIRPSENVEDNYFSHLEDNREMPLHSATSLSKYRKRGRPRKFEADNLEIKLEECLDIGVCDVKSTVTPKKPGRPRQSSYSSGYVPKAKNFQCMDCGKLLATRQSYKEHRRQHTGEGFVCDNCGQKFTTSSGFMLHKRYHSDDPHMYKCSKCKYVVSSQQLLDDHYLLRHDPNRPKSHICDVCGKAFHGSTQLEKHLFSHSNTKPYSCDQCSFTTAYPGGLEKHKYNVHVADRTLFRCELCGIHLKSKGTYAEHIGRHFNQRKKKCETCDKTFPNASQLAAHRRCHLEPAVPCGICGKKLRSKHKLKVHELIHTGQKDFKCPCCSYVTYVKHNLKKHCMARHKMDYPPLITQKMKKFKLSDVSSDGLKDPLALKCLSRLSSYVTQQSTEERGDDDGVTTAAAASTLPTASAALYPPEEKPVTASAVELLELLPMTKVEMITPNEAKTYVAEEKMYVTLSTIDRNAIIDFHCPPGAFYPAGFYVPTIVAGEEQLT